MGYRIDIRDVKNEKLWFYGTKVYGYTDESKLKSYQYLLSLGKVTEDTIWIYGWDNKIILSAEQFRKFMKLYEDDIKVYCPKYGKLNTHPDYYKIKALVESDNDKQISWH